MRQLFYGLPSDLGDDIFDVSEATSSSYFEEFRMSMKSCFGPIYLRTPNRDTLVKIEKSFREAGFSGCIGCLDCIGGTWQNYSKVLQGIMKGKNDIPAVRMEVICDLDLSIWSFRFEMPGSLNDFNISEVSFRFHDVLVWYFLCYNLLSLSLKNFLHGFII